MPEFDLRVHHRHPKTGELEKADPYRLHVRGSEHFYERPVNSGNLWFKNGEPAGRVEMRENPVTGKMLPEIIKGQPHLAYSPPPTKDQVIARQIAQKDGEIAELRRKLASLEIDQIQDEKRKEEPKIQMGGEDVSMDDLKSAAEAEDAQGPLPDPDIDQSKAGKKLQSGGGVFGE